MKKVVLFSKILFALLLLSTLAGPAAAAENYYTVRPDDNLFMIGKRYGIKFQSIISANKLNGSKIYPGQKLSLPIAPRTHVYHVRPGDNLFRIAGRYGLKASEIMAANELATIYIKAGERLAIPVRQGNGNRRGNNNSGAGGSEARPVFGEGAIARYTAAEVALMARLIHAEARGEGHLGKVAVGAVIMNRIASGKFPDNIREVIYQRTKGVYQFTPVKDGNINLEPGTAAYRAAYEALRGSDPTGGALFFYNPEKSSDRWIRTLPVTTRIGNHVFAK